MGGANKPKNTPELAMPTIGRIDKIPVTNFAGLYPL